ncbi:YqaA family protein [Kordiimonas gwangyangensis]|uniref:YqaA family protein n=1 Tax=Kordiimonas gwangyangensis TaxID=288022 RepID=UPI000361A1D4|nr:YqaA family protein [Kordiimonas gwangyangensis]
MALISPEVLLYLGLFLNAFVAATLLPAFSEVALASLIASGNGESVLLIAVATLGNVLGSILNWWLGGRALVYQDRRWFPFSPRQIERGTRLFERYGYPTLLFAWLPIIGDPLTFVAGIFRMRFLPFLVLTTLGKAGRYIVIALAANAF